MKTIVICAAACLGMLACGPEHEAPKRDKPDAGPDPEPEPTLQALGPEAGYADKTLEEWGVEYVRWYYAQTSCENDVVRDKDGSLCGFYQDPESPVFFLSRAPYSSGRGPVTERTMCHVPAGKAIVVPIAAFFNDNAGVAEPLSDEALQQSVRDVKDSMRYLELKADGVEVADLESRGIGVTTLSYRVPPSPNKYSCSRQDVADTVVEPSYLAGYFAIFEPPEPGAHEVEYGSLFTYETSTYTYHVKASLTVDSPDE